MSTNHNPGGHTPLHTEDNDHAHQVLDHAAQHHHKKHKPKGAAGITLNVTSMVDILFNLLVYFIVTANFAMDEGSLKANLPAREGPGIPSPGIPSPDIPSGGMLHHLDIRGLHGNTTCQLFFDGKSMADFAALRAALIARKQPPNPPTGNTAGLIHPKLDTLVIRPAPGVRWQHVVNAFNQVTGAGYERVSFAPERATVAAR